MVRGNTARLRLVDKDHDREAPDHHEVDEEPVAPEPRGTISAAAADVTGDI